MKIKGYFRAKVKGLSEEDWFGYEFDGNKLFFSEKYINLYNFQLSPSLLLLLSKRNIHHSKMFSQPKIPF